MDLFRPNLKFGWVRSGHGCQAPHGTWLGQNCRWIEPTKDNAQIGLTSRSMGSRNYRAAAVARRWRTYKCRVAQTNTNDVTNHIYLTFRPDLWLCNFCQYSENRTDHYPVLTKTLIESTKETKTLIESTNGDQDTDRINKSARQRMTSNMHWMVMFTNQCQLTQGLWRPSGRDHSDDLRTPDRLAKEFWKVGQTTLSRMYQNM